jgi:hypothetical protein
MVGNAPLTHPQVADAMTKIDQAGFHANRLSALMDANGAEGSEWKLDERAKARADMGAVVGLARQAADILYGAGGGSSIYSDIPIQRIFRDVYAIGQNALMNSDTNGVAPEGHRVLGLSRRRRFRRPVHEGGVRKQVRSARPGWWSSGTAGGGSPPTRTARRAGRCRYPDRK